MGFPGPLMTSYTLLPLGELARVTVEGQFDLASTQALVLDIARDAGAAGKNLLVDIRGVRSRLSFPDVYRVVQVVLEHPEAYSGRIALLDDYNAQFEKAQFFEASSSVAGIQARTFLEESEAIAWLHGPA
ncbi:hypothetical protein B1759_09660 [Rubrivirga sp. SAORIC476]|nr:hypothetical protein [Rhodothermaceae bacterium]MBC12967.1 hypothetical protein [Rhodothermaceae bacterium]MBE25916.1 hypothetical protein [Rhodospirillaceae bacterium]PAP81567.1 hypothetical protein B1759_09660 [Rubrivirga sp. SAORIC476]